MHISATHTFTARIRSGDDQTNKWERKHSRSGQNVQNLMQTGEAILPWLMAEREEAMEPAGKMTEDMDDDGTITVCCG